MRIVKLATLVALLALPAWSAASPKISLDKESYDYGPVQYGHTVTQEFTVTNTGDQTLVIQRLRSSCGCTKAIKGSKSIPPGGKTKVVASFNTNGLSPGRKRQSIFVDSNDPERPSVRLTLRADVVRELDIDKASLVKRLPAYVETVSFPVKISNSSDKPYTVKGIRSDSQSVRASLHPEELLVQPKSSGMITIELRLEKDSQRHYYNGGLVLETDHPSEREIDLPYFVKLNSSP
jgi:hypothetical protein